MQDVEPVSILGLNVNCPTMGYHLGLGLLDSSLVTNAGQWVCLVLVVQLVVAFFECAAVHRTER